MAEIRIGISGWRYDGWRGSFYPEGLLQRRELEYASVHLNSIEINGSFYSLQRPKSYQAWRETTPPGFVFSVKATRYVTHMKRLVDIEIPLANFFASGVLALEEKLGPFLWQFPPSLQFNAEKFEAFFELLPRTTFAAVELGRHHDNRLSGRVWLNSDQERKLRHCVEIRHESFMIPEFFELLRKHNIGYVVADTARHYPFTEDVTADFVYARLHGDEELYVSGYSEEALQLWAARIRAWMAGGQLSEGKRILDKAPPVCKERDVYIYFDNDAKVRAPFDAMRLAEMLNVNWKKGEFV